MSELYIFSQDGVLLTTLTESTGLVSAPFRDEINSVASEPFVFTVDADIESAKYVKEENRVVFKDKDGYFREMVIKELDDIDNDDGPQTTATCIPAWLDELNDNIVLEKQYTNKEAQLALDDVLAGTRYVGEVKVSLGLASTNFHLLSSADCIWKILEVWGGEFRDTIEFVGNKITVRKIIIDQRLGADKGARFEIDHNIEEIQRTVLSYPKTALYGWGANLEVTDDEGNQTNGYTRYIDFGDAVWLKAKGDPTDKPKGQKWVGDPDALLKYGREHNGQLLHRYGEFSNQDYEDPAKLLQATWEALKQAKKPEVHYKLSVDLLDKDVSLGDTAVAIDRQFARPIEIQTRIIAIEYDLLDIDGTAVVEMGQFLSAHDNDLYREIDNLKESIRNPKERLITNDSFPDTKPGTPMNVEVYGAFQTIQLFWDYDSKVYISHYEVYGSEVKDFTPDSQHFLWRGRTSSFVHEVETDEVWYYRVRAVNTRGTPGDFSPQVSAATVRIITDDILFGSIIKAHIADLAIDASKLSDLSVNQEKLVDGAVITEKIADAAIEASKIAEEAIVSEKIGYGAITNEKLADLAITAEKLADGTIDYINEGPMLEIQYTQAEIQATENRLLGQLNTQIGEVNTSINDLLARTSGIEGTVTSITQEVDDIEGRLSTTITQLTNMDGVVGEHTATLQQHAGLISAKAEKSEVYTRTQTDGLLGNRVDYTIYNNKMASLDISIDGLNLRATDTETNINSLTGELANATSQIANLDVKANQIGIRVSAVRADLDELDIGGRNLALGTSGEFKTVTIGEYGYSGILEVPIDGEKISHGNYVTFSVYVKDIPNGEKVYLRIDWYKPDGTYSNVSSNERFDKSGRYNFTSKIPNDSSYNRVKVRLMPANWVSNYQVAYKEAQLEKGNRATAYGPAIEDTDARITSAEASITTLAGKIELKASQTSVDSLTGRMSNAESSINLLSNEIDLKVNKDGVITGINVSTEGVRISGNKIHLTGQTLIDNGIIGSAAIANAAITNAKIKDLDAGKITTGILVADRIGAKTISADKLATGTIVATSGVIADAAITNAMIANLAVSTAKIANAAITTAKIANLAVDDAKIADLSVNKLKAGTIDTSKIKILGGSAIDYTSIDGSHFESRGRFSRTWKGTTKTHDIKLKFENGYLRARNENEDQSIYFSDFGISTYANGSGDERGPSSGTIEFFSYEFSNYRGITVHSHNGVVGLKSESNKIVLDAGSIVEIPRSTLRTNGIGVIEGYQNFYIGVSGTLNGEARVSDKLFYDDGNVRYMPIKASAFRDPQGRTAYINGSGSGNTGIDPGRTVLQSGGLRTIETHLYLAVTASSGGEVRVTDSYGYNEGNGIIYRPIRASEFKDSSGNTAYMNGSGGAGFNTNPNALTAGGIVSQFTHLYLGAGTSGGEARVTDHRGSNNLAYRPIRAREFITDTSVRENKTNIKVYRANTLDVWRNANIYLYNRLDDETEAKQQLGMMIDELPIITHSEAGDSFGIYALTSFVGKGVKDLVSITDNHEDRINWLEIENQYLKQKIKQLEDTVA